MANQNYSQQDFQSVYEDLLAIVESSTTKWHPRTSTEADPGVVILKAIAFLEDKAGYRFDMALNQAYPDTVSDRQSAYELLKMLGYLMKQARAATGQISLLPLSGWSSDVPQIEIPVFTSFTDSTGTLKFFATDSYIFNRPSTPAAWNTNFIVNVQAGEPFQITKDGVTYFTLKDVDEQGKLYLGKTGLAQNGVFVLTRALLTDGASAQEVLIKDWTYVDYSILKPTDTLWYTVGTADDGEMFVQFPENFANLLANVEIAIYATYTDGAASNISKDIISKFLDDSQWRSYFAVSQSAPFTTGQDQESIDSAVANYYATKDVCSTIITAADFSAALKNLLISAAYANSPNFPAGDNYLTNAVVRTAADRKTKIATVCYDKSYILYQPDTTEPSNQVDLIGLSSRTTTVPKAEGAAVSYAKDFARITKSNFPVDAIQQDFNYQLQDNVAVDVDMHIDEDTPRILAVTTPQLTVRISNYSTAAAVAIYSKIQDYFYSTYQAKNLVPGTPLSVQKIIDDIYAISPIITSVSLPDLTYDMYTRYKAVDGEATGSAPADIKISVEPNDNSPALSSLDSIQTDILTRSILQGSVPLYKYSNRQNAASKTTAEALAYIAADTSSDDAVSFVPWNATSVDTSTLAKATEVSAKVESLPSVISPDGYSYDILPLVSKNQLLQIRTPIMVTTDTYGFGMRYKFNHKRLLVEDTIFQTITAGTVIATGSTFHKVTGYNFSSDTRFNEVVISGSDVYYEANTTLVAAANFTSDDLLPQSGSVLPDYWGIKLKASSQVAINSMALDVIETPLIYNYFLAPAEIADGQEYTLFDGETLDIIKSSTTEVVQHFKGGDTVLPAGLSLVDTTTFDTQVSAIMTTAQSISKLAADVSNFSTDYVYFLSLTSNSSELKLTPGSTYMLRENELFVIANRAVTEYLSFGPGTEIANNTAAVFYLSSTPLVSLAEVNRDMFSLLPAEISVRAFNFTTYGAGSVAAIPRTDHPDDNILTSTTWTSTANSGLLIFKDLGITSTTALPDILSAIARSTPDFNAATASSNSQIRGVISLATDATGLLELEKPFYRDSNQTSYTLTLTYFVENSDDQQSLSITVPPTGSDDNAFITSTVPFSTVAESAPARLVATSDPVFTFGAYSTNYSGLATVPSYNAAVITVPLSGFPASSDPDLKILDVSIVNPAYSETAANRKPAYATAHIAFSSPLKEEGSLTFDLDSNSGATIALMQQSSLTFSTTLSLSTLDIPQFVYGFDVAIKIPSTKSKAVLTLKLDNHAAAFEGNTITVSKLSYIVSYANELGIESPTTFFGGDDVVLASILSADENHRFCYSLMPTEAYSYPLSAEAFFSPSHPYNKLVFPYIQIDPTQIKILSNRR